MEKQPAKYITDKQASSPKSPILVQESHVASLTQPPRWTSNTRNETHKEKLYFNDD